MGRKLNKAPSPLSKTITSKCSSLSVARKGDQTEQSTSKQSIASTGIISDTTEKPLVGPSVSMTWKKERKVEKETSCKNLYKCALGCEKDQKYLAKGC